MLCGRVIQRNVADNVGVLKHGRLPGYELKEKLTKVPRRHASVLGMPLATYVIRNCDVTAERWRGQYWI